MSMGDLLRGPWYQEGVFGMCSSAFITIWSLIIANLEETNLTSRLRVYGLKVSRIIIATRGPREEPG
jgi:hypothetical protein